MVASRETWSPVSSTTPTTLPSYREAHLHWILKKSSPTDCLCHHHHHPRCCQHPDQNHQIHSPHKTTSILSCSTLAPQRTFTPISRATWPSRGVQKIQKLSETPATAHRVAKLYINDSKNRKNHDKLVQPVAPHLCMNPKPQKSPISKMSQTYWVGYQIISEEK